jgi:hypothetical protein
VERNMSKGWVGVGTGCSIGYMEERLDFGSGLGGFAGWCCIGSVAWLLRGQLTLTREV